MNWLRCMNLSGVGTYRAESKSLACQPASQPETFISDAHMQARQVHESLLLWKADHNGTIPCAFHNEQLFAADHGVGLLPVGPGDVYVCSTSTLRPQPDGVAPLL